MNYKKYLLLSVFIICVETIMAQKAVNTSRCYGDSCIVIMHSEPSFLKRVILAKHNEQWKNVLNVKGEKPFGFSNTSGKIIIPITYENAEPFYKGYAVVTINDLQGIIDSTGKMVIKPKYKGLSNLSEGSALYSLTGDKVDGFVDINGKETPLDPSAGTIDPKVNGTFLSNVPTDSATIVFIKKALIPYSISEGTVVCDRKVIDRNGKLLFYCDYALSDCKDGMFRIYKMEAFNDYRYGFVNKKGTIIAQPIYRDAENFSNGKALVTSGSPAKPIKKYINKFGEVVEIVK